jgi:hypothetical protein
MRRLIFIASLVGLFMYVGFAAQPNALSATELNEAKPLQLTGLHYAFEAAGGKLEQATITAWSEVTDASVQQRAAKLLGWREGDAPEGESRSLIIHRKAGVPHLSLRWVLTGRAAERWSARAALVNRAMLLTGPNPSLTVQLEGVTEKADLLGLGTKGMDALGAKGRQVWSSPAAVSIAGRSVQLPPSAFGVNVQIAVRTDSVTKRNRLWVAWPALLQEY